MRKLLDIQSLEIVHGFSDSSELNLYLKDLNLKEATTVLKNIQRNRRLIDGQLLETKQQLIEIYHYTSIDLDGIKDVILQSVNNNDHNFLIENDFVAPEQFAEFELFQRYRALYFGRLKEEKFQEQVCNRFPRSELILKSYLKDGYFKHRYK
jgi:hypothetical protein